MELKPCPFCESDPDIERFGNARQSTIYVCGNCGATLETGEEWDHGRRWNERPTEEKLAARIAQLEAEVERWEKSFVGHVYVKNEEYRALCEAAKNPNYILSLKAEQINAIQQCTELRERLATIINVAQGTIDTK